MNSRILVAATAVALFGLGGIAPAAAQDKVEVTFWSIFNPETNHNGQLIAEAAAAFNAANPDVEVTIIGQGGYDGVAEKLDAALIANDTPVIAQIDESFLARYHPVAVDLGQYLKPETVENYVDGLMRSSYVDGKFLAAPFNRSTPILYVNSDIMRAHGLPPEGPKSWDELKEFAKKVADPANDKYGFVAYWDSDAWYWESMLYSWGGSIFTEDNQHLAFNTEAGWKPVADFQEMVREGSMLNVYNHHEKGGIMAAAFLEGRAAMFLDSIGGMSRYYNNTDKGFEMAVAFQPAGTEHSVVTGGANLIIIDRATEEQKVAAARFIEYLATDEFVARFFDQTGYFPVTESSMQTEIVRDRVATYPGYQVAFDQLATARIRPFHNSWRAVYTVLVDELESALTNLDRSPQEVIESAYTRGEQILAEAE